MTFNPFYFSNPFITHSFGPNIEFFLSWMFSWCYSSSLFSSLLCCGLSATHFPTCKKHTNFWDRELHKYRYIYIVQVYKILVWYLKRFLRYFVWSGGGWKNSAYNSTMANLQFLPIFELKLWYANYFNVTFGPYQIFHVMFNVWVSKISAPYLNIYS